MREKTVCLANGAEARHASPNSQNVSSATVGLEGRASKRDCRGVRHAARRKKELLFAGASQPGGRGGSVTASTKASDGIGALEYAVYSRRGVPGHKHKRGLPP